MKRLLVLATSVMITMVAKHAYSSGFLGGVGGGGGVDVGGKYGINVETLTGNKTLVPGVDEIYQYLKTGGDNRYVTLMMDGAKPGDRFVIRNDDDYDSPYYIEVEGQYYGILDYVYAQGIKKFIFNGQAWVPEEVGSGGPSILNMKVYNTTLGQYSTAYNYGTSLGITTESYNHSVSIGYYVWSGDYGVAIGGYDQDGSYYGTAVGTSAYGYNEGVAVGYSAYGYDQGVAIGYNTTGANYGITIGYNAGTNQNYQASHNIAIGQNVNLPSASGTRQLNIGNVLYGTGMYSGTTPSSDPTADGKIGIRVATPNSTLQVGGSLSLPITVVTANVTLDDTYYTVLCDASAGAVTITLPPISGITGRIYNVKKIDSSANACTVAASGTETIDGASSQTLSAQYDVITVQAGPSEWSKL